MMHNSDGMKRVQENDWVLVKRIFDEGFRLVRAERESCYYLVRHRVNTDSLIGAYFGSMMELNKNGKKLVPVDLSEEEMFELGDLDAASEVMPEENDCKDNRNLIDDHGSSQRLTMEEIESLKTQASSDMEIVHNLCKNSSTFADKSVFSQAKYIKKKKQKYTNFFMVYKPTVRLLCEMYFNQRPGKATTLRIDTLSQLLNSCNVRSGGHYIVVDNFTGLLAAAVIERLVGDGIEFPGDVDTGTCVQMYLEQGPTATWRTCVDALNLPAELLTRVLLSYQIHQAYSLLNAKSGMEPDTKDAEPAAAAAGAAFAEFQPKNGQVDGQAGDWEAKKRKLDEKAVERNKRRAERKVEEGKARSILSARNLDAFILITRNFDPCLPAQVLIEFLAPSAPFAIFSPIIEPLAQCLLHLKGRAVNLRLSETWLRRYQVLPGRTRPDMNMSGSGGFILTGTKLASPSSCSS